MIGNILLAVDGSPHSLRATDLAAELANKLSAKLFIVHVLMHGRPPSDLVRMAQVEHLVERAHAAASPDVPYVAREYPALLDGTKDQAVTARVISAIGDQIVARAKARSGELGARDVKTIVRAGDYADSILKEAEETSADMIVIGSRGLGRITSTVLGSVSQKVLNHADCAVLTAR